LSGIAAIIRFDGRDVEPGSIERMTKAMDYRGPDGIRHLSRGPVALGHCQLQTTAESLEEVQPLCNEDETLIVVLDGWLSNYSELRCDLLARGAQLRTRSDAELVLRAYEIWGEDCPKYIDGEFAFVIWDRHRHQAYMAGDHIGLKPIHYHWDGRQLIVASDIVGVLAAPGVMRELNAARIAEHLTFEWATRGETIWKGVMRAIPARWMRFSNRGSQSSQYWKPSFSTKILYKGDEEYFEHYRELFSDCVRRSSRTHKPLACDVSGGLDSSAVFAMAHQLRRKGALPAPEVKGYTYSFSDAAGTEHDEIEYARAVAQHVGEHVHEVSPFLPGLEWFFGRAEEDCNIAGYPNGAMSIAIGESLVEDGCRVILNGEGGDEWLAGKPYYFAEQLASRDWRTLSRFFSEDSAEIGFRKSLSNVLRFGLKPLVPNRLVDARRKLLDVLRSKRRNNAAWLSVDFRNSLAGRWPLRPREELIRIKDWGHRSKYMVMTDPFALVVWDQFSRQSGRLGYEIRTPMYARKFIEFSFATPERMRLRGDTRKFIHIKALTGLLPELVASRKTKADFGVSFMRLLEAVETYLAAALQESGSRYLNPEGVAELFNRQRSEPANFWLVWHLWTLAETHAILQSCSSLPDGEKTDA
jgi:asparagine synthase (glutamine-hydrolysing)